MDSDLDVSFIIPCYNEADRIGTTIHTIKDELRTTDLSYEIIIVDNQSKDQSATIASNAGAHVLSSGANTVAAVRNHGFKKSSGIIIVFLDADVQLCPGWGKVFSETIKNKKFNKYSVIGSHCAVPQSIKEPLASWYRGIEHDSRDTHLGTGHMIMSRDFFMRVGMFNNQLKSGEDYEFCQRAINHGGEIHIIKGLKVYHMGYPTSIKDFIKRESWHGASDFMTIKSLLRSKVALASIIFFILNFTLATQIIIGSKESILASSISILIFLSAIVIIKFGYENIRTFYYRVITSYFYFAGRILSLKTALLSKINII